MDYYAAMERAVAFIEANITEPLSVEDVARHAFQSRWHFQRIFRLITGFSVYSYIKRRRLSEAGNDLLLSRDKIIEIALKYQYGTPESFLRAFRKEFSANPSEYRRGREHRGLQRITVFRDPVRVAAGTEALRTQIVVRSEALFVGRKYRTTMRQMRNEADIPAFWGDFHSRGALAAIPHRRDGAAMGIYCNWDFEENFDVLIGAQVERLDAIPEEMAVRRIAPAKYMAFTVPGNTNEDILRAWKYIYGVWMPETGYGRGLTDDFDLFDDRFTRSENPESEIYIPLS
jgi:AraC family transcriptional regulator